MMRSVLSVIALLASVGASAQSAGQLDTTFADSGYVITNGTVELEHAQDLLLLPDGRVVVSGTAIIFGNSLGVARFMPDGQLDPTFGNAGSCEVDAGGIEHMEGSALLADGSLLFSGFTSTNAVPQVHAAALIKLDSSGTPDPGFANAGRYLLQFPNEQPAFTDVEVDTNGRSVACGTVSGELLLHRVFANGTADPSFGNAGSVRLQYNNTSTTAASLVLQPDGRIVTAGTRIARFEVDGELDSLGFGVDGWAALPMDLTSDVNFQDLILQPDGRILATGWTSPPPDTLIVVRLLPDGTPDSSFAQDGSLKLPLQDRSNGAALALQPDGMIVVTGSTEDFGAQTIQVLLARIDPFGVLDPLFGQNGIVLFSPNVPAPHYELGTGVVIGSDGGITLCASYYGSPNRGFLVARFLGNDIVTGATLPVRPATDKVWPVPAEEVITVECSACAGQVADIGLFDATGRLVRSQRAAMPFAQPRSMMDVQGLPGGVYQLRVACGAGAHAFTVILR